MTPLLVATESLSQLGLLGALPWLLYFNFIIVLPLIAITLIIYQGFTTAENVSQWKERNIKILHLIAGILLFAVGLSLLIGWL
jgi:cytochrome c biogenesis protein CcdA